MSETKHTGIIKFFKVENGFGFITSGNRDYFFHFSSYNGDHKLIKNGDAVAFNVKPCRNKKGLEAYNVECDL